MKSVILWVIVLGAAGLAVGYFFFGQFNGSYIPVGDLLPTKKSFLNSLGQAIIGIDTIRQNVLVSGAVGAVIGAVIGAVSGRKR